MNARYLFKTIALTALCAALSSPVLGSCTFRIVFSSTSTTVTASRVDVNAHIAGSGTMHGGIPSCGPAYPIAWMASSSSPDLSFTPEPDGMTEMRVDVAPGASGEHTFTLSANLVDMDTMQPVGMVSESFTIGVENACAPWTKACPARHLTIVVDP